MMKTAILTLMLLVGFCAAEEPEDLNAAVTHLLKETGESGATFIRNKKSHDAKEAAEHMKKKYEHFVKKGKIKTAEDFIRLAATKSLISGKPYKLKLPDGTEHLTAEWMTEALKTYREQTAQ